MLVASCSSNSFSSDCFTLATNIDWTKIAREAGYARLGRNTLTAQSRPARFLRDALANCCVNSVVRHRWLEPLAVLRMAQLEIFVIVQVRWNRALTYFVEVQCVKFPRATLAMSYNVLASTCNQHHTNNITNSRLY